MGDVHYIPLADVTATAIAAILDNTRSEIRGADQLKDREWRALRDELAKGFLEMVREDHLPGFALDPDTIRIPEEAFRNAITEWPTRPTPRSADVRGGEQVIEALAASIEAASEAAQAAALAASEALDRANSSKADVREFGRRLDEKVTERAKRKAKVTFGYGPGDRIISGTTEDGKTIVVDYEPSSGRVIGAHEA
jgi:hypothetical protein